MPGAGVLLTQVPARRQRCRTACALLEASTAETPPGSSPSLRAIWKYLINEISLHDSLSQKLNALVERGARQREYTYEVTRGVWKAESPTQELPHSAIAIPFQLQSCPVENLTELSSDFLTNIRKSLAAAAAALSVAQMSVCLQQHIYSLPGTVVTEHLRGFNPPVLCPALSTGSGGELKRISRVCGNSANLWWGLGYWPNSLLPSPKILHDYKSKLIIKNNEGASRGLFEVL